MLPMVEAKISITYNDTTNNTTQYISNYNDYKSFIIQDNDKYLYDGTSLESSTSLGLTKSGLLNVFEFNVSKNSSGDTYLFTGLKYWTMTSSSGGKYVIDPSTSIKYKSYSETSNSGARYTQYIMDCTQTIGDGSLNNPWQLVKTDDSHQRQQLHLCVLHSIVQQEQ